MVSSWVLIDGTNGAPAQDGAKLSSNDLRAIAAIVQTQLNGDFAPIYGGTYAVRAGSSLTDVQPGEKTCLLEGAFPDPQDAGASAFHDRSKKGDPEGYVAVSTCTSIYGYDGVCNDVSHEILEAERNPACNIFFDDENGKLHAGEVCDAVEVQQYRKSVGDGSGDLGYVSNFLLFQSWANPQGEGPFDFMCLRVMDGAVSPDGPMQTAVDANQGNYQIIAKFSDSSEKQAFDKPTTRVANIEGRPRKPIHPRSRKARILRMINGHAARQHEAAAAKASAKTECPECAEHAKTQKHNSTMVGVGVGAALGGMLGHYLTDDPKLLRRDIRAVVKLWKSRALKPYFDLFMMVAKQSGAAPADTRRSACGIAVETGDLGPARSDLSPCEECAKQVEAVAAINASVPLHVEWLVFPQGEGVAHAFSTGTRPATT